VGVALVSAITATYFGWIRARASATSSLTVPSTVGTQLVASNGTDGAVEPFAGVQAIVGQAITDIDTTQYGAVRLFL